MKPKQPIIALSIVALLTAAPVHAGWKHQGQQPDSYTSQPITSEPLSLEESEKLTFMREEEKLARDVYLTLYEQWKHPVFSNISSSEQRHMEAMERQLDNYEIVDPVMDDSIGMFTNTDLANLYAELIAKGQTSLINALMVGALIEEIDIEDLQHAIADSTHPDLTQTYENLIRGSRNHLRAFVRQIESLGVPYTAQALDQLQVEIILEQPMEQGRTTRGRR
ncbi:DUF2202 domain-containing protein [Candidatus Endoriftia persephonae]|jgi:hypothetical protein|uniref:Ferritin-like protein n=2 Tax=Gammaproteobacteria TaxID=1236 RepID=G2FIJ1_9GAMM|nr:DUF2202 domain-containing protein [Candidatus Endoriftia persephone]EGW53381.1 ferritin-like protein [endosymbiont of Tevnia jerichonana (vent Tica)]USF87115.1 DUF2202 domain-containing protein [Candidatus Endoriftia persephone]